MTELLRRLLRTPQGAAGLLIVVLVAAACVLGPALAPLDPDRIDFLGRSRSWRR